MYRNVVIKLAPFLYSEAEAAVSSVIRHCRSYFAAGSTEEMLEEFLPHLCPFDDAMTSYLKYFDMFIPVATRQNDLCSWVHTDTFLDFLSISWILSIFSFCSSIPLCTDMIKDGPYYECHVHSLISRLAYRNIGLIDWEDYIPLFMTKVRCRSSNIVKI